MTFRKLSDYFERLEKTASRNQMTAILAELFKRASADEASRICYLSLGRLAPLYVGKEFNLAEKMMIKALSLAYQQVEPTVKKEFKKRGDLGDMAALFDQRNKSKNLSVIQVFGRLEIIANEAGEGSVERKIKKMAGLLSDLDAQGAKYAVRIPLGKLRLGFSDKTILDALSWLIAGDKSKREEIEAAYNVRADVGQIARAIKKEGLKGLKKMKVQPGVPVMPALCQRLPTAEKMIEKMGKVAVEPKYDGTRVQVHWGVKEKGDTLFKTKRARIFTRNLENVTHMFPDIIKALSKEVKAQNAILDGEVIGFNPKTGKFLPFQETIKRKRKHQIGLLTQQIPLKFFVFDLLFVDGRQLLSAPFEKRRQFLAKTVSPHGKTIILSPQIVTSDPKELKKYHDEQIKKGLEGVVVKKWQSAYDPGKRGYTWVKFKQEKGKKGGGLSDTLDCVVMGYYRGRGRRASFGIGMFLVGIRESEKSENFLTVSKVGTGLTDKQWREMKGRSQKYEVRSQPKEYAVDKNLAPDVWLRPGIVVEIEADNVTNSPIHTAHYALRFPRLVRFRDDKSPQEATTIKETEKLYRLQK